MRKELQLEDFRLAVMAVWKVKILIICLAVFGMFSGLLYIFLTSENQSYRADSSVYCAIYNNASSASSLTTDVTAAITNYTDVISSEKVAEYAASLITDADLTAEDIKKMIYFQINSNSYVISISAYSADPKLAVEVSNAVAQAFVSEMANITDSASVHILDTAITADQVQTTSKMKTLLACMMIPVLLAAFVVIIKSLLSDRVYSIIQCVEQEEEILGIVPDIE